MASLFLDFPCAVSGGAKVRQVTWCGVEPICAVVTDDNRISFYLEEGICLEECKIQRKCTATAAAWHPKAKLIASGWEDGHVSVWSIGTAATCCFASDKKHARSPLRVCAWSPSTTRLVTGDGSGTIIVWKADGRGGLSEFREYVAGSGVTCAAYSTKSEGPSVFFAGTSNGSVYAADDLGQAHEVTTLGARIDHMLFYEAKQRLVVLTRALVLVQLEMTREGRAIPVMKMKVSVAGGGADRGVRHVCWAGPGVIAAATGEALVRFWNLATDETYVLGLATARLERTARVASVAFNPLQRYLAVGTRDGRIAMWRFLGDYQRKPSEDVTTSAADWEAMPHSTACGGPIEELAWGPGQGLLAAASPDGATSLLSETVLHRLLRDDVGAIQLSTDTVRVERQNGASAVLRTDISIRGLAVSSRHIVAWNGQEARVYEWVAGDPRQIAKFPTTARAMALRDDTLVRTSTNLVELCNLQGVRKQKIPFSDGEGSPTHLDINGNFLAVATDTGLIKIFQVDRREPKQLGSPGRFDLEPATKQPGSPKQQQQQQQQRKAAMNTNQRKKTGKAIRSIKCNADGTRVSILADHVHGSSVRICEPDSRLHVYDTDRDVVDAHDFGAVRRYPVSHYWDPLEPKLLACETRALRSAATSSDATARQRVSDAVKYSSLGLSNDENRDDEDSQKEKEALETRSKILEKKLARSAEEEAGAVIEVTTLFVTADHGMLLQDVFALEAPLEALLGVQVPRLFFTRTGASPPQQQQQQQPPEETKGEHKEAARAYGDVGLCSRVMRDFVGLDEADEQTRAALLNFSYYLTVGNMDEAHRAVRLIKSPSVWENMAHMCVKTKRLDVAEVCLGHMGHARGSAAVRLAKDQASEVEARVAAVAVQLGLRNDAARLLRECRRYDLLNELYQAAGEWYLALDTAERFDRIHLRSTHHRYALHLESLGQYDAAARHFELADTHRREVPRMLVARGEQAALERYVMRSEDAELLKWWAGYCESLGHLDSAQTCYDKANDYFNLVRVACLANDVPRAADLVDEGRSAAGAYHLARHLEGRGDVTEAIQYFAKSGCYNHAIRLAKEYGLDTDLMQFCIKARPSLQVECAHYFENKGEFEKAVQLYQKGGDLAKALDLCFKVGGSGRAEMFEVLANISKDIDASPAVLARCAEFFIEHDQYEEAVKLYIRGGRFGPAIALCVDRNVKISDDLAEELTPEKSEKIPASERTEILVELAKALKKQQSWGLACKKYTQAGDRPRALKCLLKSGDTKNIIYYASVSRNRDIYILAANYLQSLDWHASTDEAQALVKKIVEFYTKAKAYEQLASFYDAFSQVEIDEYRDYDKALGALKESKAQLDKLPRSSQDKDRRIAALTHRIAIVTDFVQARKYEKSDPDKMVSLCTDILQRRDVDLAIRVGDAYALMIENHHANGQPQDAFALIQQMRQRSIVLHPYIEQDLLEQIHKAVGAEPPTDARRGTDSRHTDDEEDDEIPDEILDDTSDAGSHHK